MLCILATTEPDATASSLCSSRWDTSPIARTVVAYACTANVRTFPSTWLCTEVASAITASVTPCMCHVASATYPMLACSSSCALHCTIESPMGDTTRRGLGDTKRKRINARDPENTVFLTIELGIQQS